MAYHPGFRRSANDVANTAPWILRLLFKLGWDDPLLRWVARRMANV